MLDSIDTKIDSMMASEQLKELEQLAQQWEKKLEAKGEEKE
jgi:hypothetical protein